MNEQEKHAVSQEERKEKIRARYKGVDRSELEFIPAKQKGNWEILRPAKTVEGMEIITREILDDLMGEAEKLIDRMRCATYE